MRTHYGPWQPCWISNQHQKHKSGRGPSSEHFWQVWLKSVQLFQSRRVKCEKLTDGRTRWLQYSPLSMSGGIISTFFSYTGFHFIQDSVEMIAHLLPVYRATYKWTSGGILSTT
jgi:hypothetical protein